MNRALVGLGLLLVGFPFAPASQAAVIERVSVSYANGRATVDFDALTPPYPIVAAKITRCASEPGVYGCEAAGAEIMNILPGGTETLVLKDSGLYHVELYSAAPFLYNVASGLGWSFKVWDQYVVNLHRPSSALRTAIEAHAPRYSFHPAETFFPISLDALFRHGRFKLERIGGPIYEDLLALFGNSPDDAADYLRTNGHSRSRVRLELQAGNIPDELIGSRDDFPIYWHVERSTDEEAWVTYFALFARDAKYADYLADPILAGGHDLDRESVAVRFVRSTSGAWVPAEVVYAGHLPSQRTTFLGCQDASRCQAPGEPLEAWDGGKASVAWNEVARDGRHPIAFVAHGSHAMTPGHGFYRVNLFGPIAGVTGEPSGAPGAGSTIAPAELIELDLSRPDHAPLAFSGAMIRGLDLPGRVPQPYWYRLFPFVRYPTSAWTDEASRRFGECVQENGGCERYLHRVELPAPPPDAQPQPQPQPQPLMITGIDTPYWAPVEPQENRTNTVSIPWSGQATAPLSVHFTIIQCAPPPFDSCESTVKVFEAPLPNPLVSFIGCTHNSGADYVWPAEVRSEPITTEVRLIDAENRMSDASTFTSQCGTPP